MIDGNAEPLAAIYPNKARAMFLDALQGENFSLQPIVRKLVDLNLLRQMPITGPARDFYKNINAPRDID